jgi:hypothetical protein
VDEEKASNEKEEDSSPVKKGGFFGFAKKGPGAKAKPVEILATPDDEEPDFPGGRPSEGSPPDGGRGVFPPGGPPSEDVTTDAGMGDLPPGGPSISGEETKSQSRPTFLARMTGGMGKMSSNRFGVRKTKERGPRSLHNHAARAALKHREASRIRREGGEEGGESSAVGTVGSVRSDSDLQESPGTASRRLRRHTVTNTCSEMLQRLEMVSP